MLRARVVIAWVLLVGATVMWPISAATWARHEPQFVLGLSYLALIYEAFNAVQISHDARTNDEAGPH